MTQKTAIQFLCDPQAIAIMGASAKPGSPGNEMLLALQKNGYAGRIFPVNPGYDNIGDLTCYPTLSSLPERPDLVVLGVSNTLLEKLFDQVIEEGIPAAVIFANGILDADPVDSKLIDRLQANAIAAGVAICGPNCMGLLRPETGLNIGTFRSTYQMPEGGVVWLAQSGSAYSALTYNEPRLGYVLAVSTGAEIATTLADYMFWALEQPRTRVIGIFLEGVRDTKGFVDALEKAKAQNIPVVILKVGRTQKSAKMAESHAGALAGNDGAYQAIFRHYNVIQVDDLDEMAVTLALLDNDRKPGNGALATMHDSGGERELLVDLSEALNVPLAEVSDATKQRIQPYLESGLVADSPLDAYGTVNNYVERFSACAQALLDDPATSMLGFYTDPRDGNDYHGGLIQSVQDAAQYSDKPVFVASNTQLATDLVHFETARLGEIPIVTGTRASLLAVRRITDHANRQPTKVADVLSVAKPVSMPTNEAEGLALLDETGIETPGLWRIGDKKNLTQIAETMHFPVVLKTDEGHAHKSDIGGVILNLYDAESLVVAYQDMASRLGPRAMVMEMAPDGVEIGLGAFVDADFGPVITVSAGGILIEMFRDVSFALAPFDRDVAHDMVSELGVSKMLESHRGKPAANIEKLCDAISRFSHLIHAFGDQISEADVNPIIVTQNKAIAVDALFIASKLES